MKTLTKSNLEIAVIAKNRIDGCLRIDEDKTVANNGRILIEITRPEVDQDEISIKGISPVETKPFNLSVEQAISAGKLIPTSKKLPDAHKQAVVEQNGSVKIGIIDGTKIETLEPLENDFYPNYQEIIPDSNDTVFKIGLSPDYLKTICDIAGKFSDDEYRLLAFEFTKPDQAVKITTHNPTTDQKFTAVLMPMIIN